VKLVADRLGKSFDGQRVLRNVSFAVESGETLAIVGRSGCGKTTLLRMLGGFLPPDEGAVWLERSPGGRARQGQADGVPELRPLFPWFTLRKNILYALVKTRRELAKAEARALTARCLAEMGLSGARRTSTPISFPAA
jgi:ABC-type nitrate/sulfonate/bicarbonate transport system ATPase subunit